MRCIVLPTVQGTARWCALAAIPFARAADNCKFMHGSNTEQLRCAVELEKANAEGPGEWAARIASSCAPKKLESAMHTLSLVMNGASVERCIGMACR